MSWAHRARIIAHRGNSSEAPENTLAAFASAAGLPADGVELDVHLSADGVPVVIHDARLERTTNGRGEVSALRAEALEALRAGLWFDPPFPEEGVPRLESVLALLAGSALEVHLELKSGEQPYAGLAGKVAEAVTRQGLDGRVVLSSFDHAGLAAAAREAPHLPRAALVSARLAEPWHYLRRHGFEALHADYRAVDAALVEGCHEAGLAVRVYTVDDADTALRLAAMGVDGIMTNVPRRLLSAASQQG